jgi:transposase
VLAFEEGGYCVWSKRLERGQFALLRVAGSPKRGLSRTEFLALIEGVDMVVRRQRKRYRKVA